MNIERLWEQEDAERSLEVFNRHLRFVDFDGGASVKLAIAIIGTIASTAVTMYGQRQQAKAAKATAAYNASLNRMDIEQNNRNREIAEADQRKRRYLAQETAANEKMPMDFMFADLETFEYQMLVEDYNVAQANQQLEARARGGIYQGNVMAANYETQALSTAISGATTAATLGKKNTKTGDWELRSA